MVGAAVTSLPSEASGTPSASISATLNGSVRVFASSARISFSCAHDGVHVTEKWTRFRLKMHCCQVPAVAVQEEEHWYNVHCFLQEPG